MRRLIAVGLSFALQSGALGASFVHAHLDDHDPDHHGDRIVHAHFNGHHAEHHTDAPGKPALSAADDDHGRITYLQVFVAVHSESVIDPGLAPGRFSSPSAHVSVMRRAPDMVRSHGPPQSRPIESRGPPSFLS